LEREEDSAAGGKWVAIALLDRTRGNRGELISTPLSDSIERCRSFKEVFLFGRDGFLADGQPFVVDDLWDYRGRWVFKFRGIDTISAAEELKGAEVRIPIERRPPAEAGSYFVDDLIGCEVVEKASGETIGRVSAWREYGGPPLVEVAGGKTGQALLIPFARSIFVEIDIDARRLVVDMPEGLAELNEQ
jgi:16S rRNA processing protein RimM